MKSLEKSEKVTLLATIVLIGFVVAVVFHYILGFYMNSHLPWSTFLWGADTAFTDFTDILKVTKTFSPYLSGWTYVLYFPLAYILLFPFCFIPSAIWAYILFLSSFRNWFSLSVILNPLIILIFIGMIILEQVGKKEVETMEKGENV